MASPIFISNPPPGFSVVAIARGVQLAFLGAFRSLQNPKLLKSKYYRQAGLAIGVSVLLQFLVWSPIVLLRLIAYILSLFGSAEKITEIAAFLKNLQFNVLNISVFVISASRYFSQDLDELFLMSLEFIDSVYLQKHPERTDQQFHSNLVALSTDEKVRSIRPTWMNVRKKYASSIDFTNFISRYLRISAYALGLYLLGRIPVIGSIILGLISFLSLNDVIGTARAIVVFGAVQILPKSYGVFFLTTYWGSRSMVHDLCFPYFSRVRFTKIEKDQWIKSREGLLFGFGLCYFLLIKKFPWFGLLTYGFAESSVAYLITKVSDPPPNQVSQLIQWNPSQLVWNKEKELDVILGDFLENDEGFQPIPGSFIFS